MSKGNSYANGASVNNGQAMSNGPGAQEFRDGWDIRVHGHWDHMEPRLPA